MDDNKTVSYYLFEAMQARSERTIKRLIIALIIVVVLLFASNLIWAVSSNTKTDTGIIQVQNKDGNYIGDSGLIVNGKN